MQVRVLGPKDAPQLASVLRGSDHELEGDGFEFPPGLFRKRWGLEREGMLVGTAILTQDRIFHAPRRYAAHVWVLPNHRRLGGGQALYKAIEQELTSLGGADRLTVVVSESELGGQAFAEQRGFKEVWRNFQSLLDLSLFDPTDLIDQGGVWKKRGIKIESLGEWAAAPEIRQQIYELQCRIHADIPGSDSRSQLSFDRFWTWVDEECSAFFVAVDGRRCVGLHFGWGRVESKRYKIALTGVDRDYRGLGLATALRAHGIAWAKSRGYNELSTWNDSRNVPILSLNERFPFRRQPASVVRVRM